MKIQHLNSISEMSANEWNQLAGLDYPFLRHEFLAALELSGSVSPATGWQPYHIVLYQENTLVAACPLYIKAHSWGEFVFDQQWAQAYQQQGLKYYPKLLTAVPFTPCQGQRILVRSGYSEREILALLLQYLQQQCQALGLSSWHCLFSSSGQNQQLQELGLLLREGVQFQWFNQHYRDFQDYCSTFTSRKRKTIQRERQNVYQQGITFERVSGTAITDAQWQAFYQFYQLTYYKHGSSAYLNLDFFQRLAQNMPEQIVLILALKQKSYVGAALSFIGADTFYGRYWGCAEEYAHLHFEACYYQGLDYCIAQGLSRFDSGAQGEHKIARGFQPVSTYSAHWLAHPQFEAAIRQFLARERLVLQHYKEECAQMLPFKRSD